MVSPSFFFFLLFLCRSNGLFVALKWHFDPEFAHCFVVSLEKLSIKNRMRLFSTEIADYLKLIVLHCPAASHCPGSLQGI